MKEDWEFRAGADLDLFTGGDKMVSGSFMACFGWSGVQLVMRRRIRRAVGDFATRIGTVQGAVLGGSSMKYPKECPVFWDELSGMLIEATGIGEPPPCGAIDDLDWISGHDVATLEVQGWRPSLYGDDIKPLTPAAKEMLAIAKAGAK